MKCDSHLALFYGRFSTDQQDMVRQTRMFDDYSMRIGVQPVAPPFLDPATSGSVPMRDREHGAALLAAITEHAGRGIAVITTEQDRIGRDTLDIIGTIRAIWEAGAVPHFIAEGGPLERNAENELKMEIRATIAQYERNKTRDRIRHHLAGKIAAREYTGGYEPYGKIKVPTGRFTSKGKEIFELVDHEFEQHWLKQMRRWREAGWAYQAIAAELNRLNVPTKIAKGTPVKRNGEFRPHTGLWQAGNVANAIKCKSTQ